MTYYDALEVRSVDERMGSLSECLPALLKEAKLLPGYTSFKEVDLSDIKSATDLWRLPVIRKSDLRVAQKALPPFGGLSGLEFEYAFQSPGPFYEPGRTKHD